MAVDARQDELRVITPTGSLGGGFDADDFRRLVATESLDVIAVDAGSIDSGPFYLGAGKPFASRIEVKGEIGLMLKAAVEKNIPLVVGNSGYSGARVHVAWMREIAVAITGNSASAEFSWSKPEIIWRLFLIR